MGSGAPRGRVLPRNEPALLGNAEVLDLRQPRHLLGGQRAADQHARAFDQAQGLHPLVLVREGEQVLDGVRAHDDADSPLAVQAGEAVGSVDHPPAGDQRAPELVENDEVVAHRRQPRFGEGVGHVDGSESNAPAGGECGADELGLVLGD